MITVFFSWSSDTQDYNKYRSWIRDNPFISI